MPCFQSSDGEVFELVEESASDNSANSKSTLPAWMIGAGLFLCAGAIMALASSATSRANNPLPEMDARLPSTRELVEIRGVSYDLARRLRAVMDSTLTSFEKEQRIADLLDTDTLLVEVDDAPSLTFESRVLGKGVASMINPGDTQSPTITHVYRDLWVQTDPRSNRWKKLVAGGWYITNWDTLTRSKVHAPQKSWAKNPVGESVKVEDIEAKFQKELHFLKDTNVSHEEQEQHFEKVLDAMCSLQNMVTQGRVSLNRNGISLDKNESEIQCELLLTSFVKEVLCIVDVPSRIISSCLNNWVFDERGIPLSDLVSQKSTFQLYLYQEPLLDSFLDVAERVSANTNNQEMLSEMADIYLPLVEHTASDDIQTANTILCNIVNNSSTQEATIRKLAQSSSEDVAMSLIEKNSTPGDILQKIKEKWRNSPMVMDALLDRQVREQVRVIDGLKLS